ncbi:MAG: InlB B-repeat-containing protein, partial [Planctomycetota bacterium]
MATNNNSLLTIVLCACTMLFASEASGLDVSIDVSPSTLNLGSSGTPITCTVTLPKPYVSADVVSVTLEGVSPYSSTGGGGTLTCKFDRETFEAMLGLFAPGRVELTLIGQFTDGVIFDGTDTILVKFGEVVVTSSAGANGSVVPAGATTVTYGSALAFTATPGTGYQVDTWFVDGIPVQTGGTSYTLTDIRAAHTVEVTFRLLEYVVTATAGANGSVIPAGATTVT